MLNDREVLGRFVSILTEVCSSLNEEALDSGYVVRLNSELHAIQQYLAEPRPKIVCLCGSTRFLDAYKTANLRETLAGHIVLSVGCYKLSGDPAHSDSQTKQKLDVLHLRKIDLADEVLVLDVDLYVGESTVKEIAYAQKLDKRIRYWSQER